MIWPVPIEMHQRARPALLSADGPGVRGLAEVFDRGGISRIASRSLLTDARLIVDGGFFPEISLSATMIRTAIDVPFPANPLSRRSMRRTVAPEIARSNSDPCLPPGLKLSGMIATIRPPCCRAASAATK